MKIKLYRIVDDELKFFDYGVSAQIDSYTKQGYIVFIEYIKNKSIG